jgi:anionic cell wall polymer biosynthesis LytR-Cps2A-Psr (LCP) family protein
VGEVEHEAGRVTKGRVEDGVTPSASAVAAPEVVATPPGGPGEHRRAVPSKRRRRRLLAVFLALWAVVVIAAAAAWYEYGRLSHDLQVSNRRVAPPLQHALTPAPVGAARQTTLVAGIDSHKNVAGAVILARVDATRHAVEILTVPSTVGLTSGQRLRDVLRFDGVSRAIRLLSHDLRVPVNHVLLIQLAQVGAIVRSLGGITITNPAPVPYRVTGGSGVFPAGRVALTSRTVEWYLDSTEHPLTAGIVAPGDFRQAVVVRGVTDKLVHLTTPSAITGVGQTISRNFNTDLSAQPVLGIVAVRLGAHTLVDCRLGTSTDLAGPHAPATVVGFQTATRRGACTTTPLHTELPAAAVAATIIATIVTHGGSQALYWLVVATIAIWGIAACAWILMLPAVRGVRRLPRRGALPRPRRPALPHVALPALPHIALPHLGRERPHTRYGLVYRRRRSGSRMVVRVLSVPVSIVVGMLIAHVLY